MVSWALALALAAPAATAPLDDEDERYEAQGVDGKEPLPRFGEVAPGVLRSGQPNRAGLGTLAERGVKTVLSLRRWVVRGEREETARLKMAHASVAMSGWKFPTFRQVDRALAVLTDPSRQPVLVHCAFGKDRTGTVVAAYRVVVEGVPVAAAAAEAYRYGCCSVSWAGSLERWLEGYRRHRGGGGGAAAQAEQQPEFRLPDPELPAELMFDGGAARGDVTPVLCERPP
ncbi:MAG: tyrosine-protein phosphatase, partial [Elusimicrobia bacterium]|nr:tyrosine-protein phosphatase [Elusimicrobiota bacterium]